MSATDDRSRRLQGDLASRQQSMADRLVQTLADNLGERQPPPTLRREEPRGPIPAGRGRVERNYEPERNPGSGGGIASPLQEQGFAAREWWPDGIPSTDGLLQFPAPKKITMTDANGAEVVLEYAEPTP
tara:strand:- start:4508 stop:4894 length:387 start_codon:yes stop_codon:yes gene_type:complete